MAAGVSLALAITVTGCGASPTAPAATATGSLTGPLTVFAASSLTKAFSAASTTLEAGNPGLDITYSFAGSQQLVANLEAGAPADVIATADLTTMGKLVAAGLVATPLTFARNRLEIAVQKGDPRHIRTLADLANPALSVVLAAPSVPAGALAMRALHNAGVTVTPKSLELNVEAALEKVESGDADAAIVYATDVASAATLVDGVAIPDNQNVVTAYPIAVVSSGRHRAAAEAFVDDAISGTLQDALRAHGFLPP